MTGLAGGYRNYVLLSFLLTGISIVIAIVYAEPLIGLLPFCWLAFPYLYRWVIVQPAKLFWLLLVLFPLSTELNITPSLGLDFPDEPLLLLLTGIIIIQLLHQPRWFPDVVKYHTLFWVVVLYFFWLLISCGWSVEPLLSVKYILAKIWYILPLVLLPPVLLRSELQLRRMAYCLLLPMLAVVLITLVRHAAHGFSFETINKVLAPFFRNHVNYSSMLVCLLAAGWCCWLLTGKGTRLRKWIGYGLLLGVTGLLFAYSRGAWLALFAGATSSWLIRKKRMAAFVFVATAAVFISSAWLITDKRYMRFAPDHDRTVFHTDFGEHLNATLAFRDVSNAERLYRWIAGVRMLAEKPLTGFGPNSFYLHYKPYTVSRFETWVSGNPEHSTVHNYFLLVALEQGLPGLALFLTLYFGMLLRLQYLYHRLQQRLYKTIALTTGIVVMMIGVINSLSDMIETDKIGGLFWLCLGMIMLLEKKKQEEQELIA